jgi:hypothetical protein
MRRIVAVSASLAVLALLAACGHREPAPPQVVIVPQPSSPPPTVVTNQTPAQPAPSAQSTPAAPSSQNVAGVPKAKPGFGRVETVTVMPTASAGGTAPNMMSRISIRMEDGTTQYVDTSVSGLAPGDRVEITNEGYLRR